jgi:hypothetical protein
MDVHFQSWLLNDADSNVTRPMQHPWEVDIRMYMEQLVEEKLTGNPEVIRINLTQRHFVHQKFHTTCLGIKAGISRWEASDWPPEVWHGRTCMYRCSCRGGFPHALRPYMVYCTYPYVYSNRRHAYSPGQPASSIYQRTEEITPLVVTWSTSWTDNVRYLAQRFPLGTWGSFTTRVKQLKVPSEGHCSRIFPSWKFRRPPPGLNPRHSGHEVGTLPLDHGGRLYMYYIYNIYIQSYICIYIYIYIYTHF